MQYAYYVVICHASAPEEPILTDMFTSEGAAHGAYAISYSKVAQSDKPRYRVERAVLHTEPAHL